MLKYFEDVRANNEIPNPAFASSLMINRCMLLQGFTISEGHAKALCNFLSRSEGIKSLIIDDAKATDEHLAKVLEGLSSKI
jgi:hypothetical protein